MSETVNFDTHMSVRRLTEAGMDEKQAEAIVYVQASAMSSNLATKQDIQLAIEALKSELMKWMVSALFIQTTIIITLVSFIIKFL